MIDKTLTIPMSLADNLVRCLMVAVADVEELGKTEALMMNELLAESFNQLLEIHQEAIAPLWHVVGLDGTWLMASKKLSDCAEAIVRFPGAQMGRADDFKARGFDLKAAMQNAGFGQSEL
jgi:hypothetical protein